ncbi:DMT family transporter [Leptolyngbya sp. NIES-2104]|uniref:DMT family transporter n=1 Tax=Leptolyngbya sp. NIES-2104 TaxID=1552121 RepID=UPI0006ECC5BD|nr:DMT family transporter [Leptolyngbya sp. NIES-2104]GAP95508.1 permease of the drug/metabolite transporter (DMT) superfamily [Leptolyngbya sp. NIES-2104]
MRAISKPQHSQGVLLLILTTAIWGTSFALLKGMSRDLPTPIILASRFSIAAIAFSPYLRQVNANLLRDGAILGILYFGECLLALIGLETISANRSAFLISLNVILVPLFGTMLGRKLPKQILVAVGIAIAGITILSWEGGGFGIGDLLTLGCSIGIAFYILAMEAITPRHPTLPLVAVQLTVAALLGIIWAVFNGKAPFAGTIPYLPILLYLGLIITAVPIWTQTQAQRWISASEAALLYTLEPVFASIFSFFWLHEALGIRGFIGAALILSATLISQVPLKRLIEKHS